VSARVPAARGRGLFCRDDGVVDVAGLLATYLDGVPLRTACTLLGYRADGDALRLETSQGELRARVLVNAAGAWAGVVGAIEIQPTNRHVFVTEPMPDVDPTWPFVWDVRGGLYFRPESRGLLLSPCDETPAVPGDYREDPAALETLAERVATLQPGLGDLRIAYRWVGQRTFMPDRVPRIGYDAREPRLFHVAGLGGHGVTASWPIGRIAAERLLARRP
jgi:D-arginine dehydrogenase